METMHCRDVQNLKYGKINSEKEAGSQETHTQGREYNCPLAYTE